MNIDLADEPFPEASKHIRTKRNLPANWCVYLMEVLDDEKILLVGALVRPVDPAFEPHIGRSFDWIKPLQGRAQMTITRDQYRALYKEPAQ